MSALFSTFGIDWHLLLAQTVNFVVLVGVLSWLLYKPVLKMVDERRKIVEKGVEDAEKAAAELSRADAQALEKVSMAEKDAEEIVKNARAEGATERTQIMKAAEARALQVEKDAAARAHEEAERSRRESEKEIARLAMLAAEKVLREKA